MTENAVGTAKAAVIRSISKGKAAPPLPPLPTQLGNETRDVSSSSFSSHASGEPNLEAARTHIWSEDDLLAQATKALADHTRIVFLDVDGVLNTQSSRETDVNHLPPAEILQNLKFLVDSTQCKIILSSTWRLSDYKRSQLDHVFLQYGLQINGATPDLEKTAKGDRVDEILLWLEMHAAKSEHVQAWVAVDDMDLLRQNPRLKAENFVHTSDEEGFNLPKMEEALQKLLAGGWSIQPIQFRLCRVHSYTVTHCSPKSADSPLTAEKSEIGCLTFEEVCLQLHQLTYSKSLLHQEEILYTKCLTRLVRDLNILLTRSEVF